MAALKNRNIAVIIAIAAMVISLILGTHFGVNRAARNIEQGFYEGVYNEEQKYLEPAIDAQLENRINASLGIITIAANYPELDEHTKTLREARNGLIDAETIPEKALYNEKMQDPYEEIFLYFYMSETVDETDLEDLFSYVSTMDGAGSVIGRSSYNKTVQEFTNITLRKFPVNIIKALAFCDMPDYFGVEG